MLPRAVLGGGCFWCLEATFQRLKGVQKVESGYAGGKTQNPTYNDVTSGLTNHAEVVRIHYDPNIISYHEILYIFFHIHDPTTLNRQGYDSGTQYRSIILFDNQEEKGTITKVMKEVQELYKDPIVTEVKKLDQFYIAEENHQNFYNENTFNPYCQKIIKPKIEKLNQIFSKFLNKN